MRELKSKEIDQENEENGIAPSGGCGDGDAVTSAPKLAVLDPDQLPSII